MEDQCFHIHPCQHCGKKNYSTDKFSKRKKIAILKMHFGWINPWKWSSISKRLFQYYRRIQYRLKTHIEVEGLHSLSP
jgi:hypothetical protein